MLKHLYPAFAATLIFACLTGIIFPLVVTGIGALLFPTQARGSLVIAEGDQSSGKISGSTLIAQEFKNPRYFQPRPSAAGSGYSGVASGGTNLGPTSDKFINGAADHSFTGIKELASVYRKNNDLPESALVPVDAVTRSGSGLDPDISLPNAFIQMKRIARVRKTSEETLSALIEKNREHRLLGFIGEPRVNVLTLNLALDKISHN